MKNMFKSLMSKPHRRVAACDALCKQVALYLHVEACLLLDDNHTVIGGFGERSKTCFVMPVENTTTSMTRLNSGAKGPVIIWSQEAKCFPKALLYNLGDAVAGAFLFGRTPVAVCRTDEQGWPIVFRCSGWLSEIGDGPMFWGDLHLPGIGAIDPSARFSTSVIKQDTFRVQLTGRRGKQMVTVLLSPAGHEIPVASRAPSHYIAKAVMIAKTPDPQTSQSSRVFESGKVICPFPDCMVIEKIGRAATVLYTRPIAPATVKLP